MDKLSSFTKEKWLILHAGLIRANDIKRIVPNLTYRKINSWCAKGLVADNRATKDAGWRMFSLIDIILFRIISDLREYGCSINVIKNILNNLLNRSLLHSALKPKAMVLEHSIFSSFLGYKILMLIDADSNILLLNEDFAAKHYFISSKAKKPVLILPFFQYAQEILESQNDFKIKTKEHSTIFNLLNKMPLSTKEKQILEVIRNNDYDEIKITKKNGSTFLLKATTRKQGNFENKDVINAINSKDYQNITVSRVGGKKISIIQEETIKIK